MKVDALELENLLSDKSDIEYVQELSKRVDEVFAEFDNKLHI